MDHPVYVSKTRLKPRQCLFLSSSHRCQLKVCVNCTWYILTNWDMKYCPGCDWTRLWNITSISYWGEKPITLYIPKPGKESLQNISLKHPPLPALSDVVIQLVKLLDFNVISPTCLNPLSPFRLLVYQFTELILSTLLCVHRVVTEISIMTMVWNRYVITKAQNFNK